MQETTVFGFSCLFNSVYLCYVVDHTQKGLEPAPIFHQVIPKVFIYNTQKKLVIKKRQFPHIGSYLKKAYFCFLFQFRLGEVKIIRVSQLQYPIGIRPLLIKIPCMDPNAENNCRHLHFFLEGKNFFNKSLKPIIKNIKLHVMITSLQIRQI